MSWLSRFGAFFLFCLFSLQTIASSIEFTKLLSESQSCTQYEQYLQYQGSNEQIICQELLYLGVEKIEQKEPDLSSDLNKFIAFVEFEYASLAGRSKSVKAFASFKIFLFDSVQIIFPFHNFW